MKVLIAPDFDRITDWLEDNQLHYGINTNFNELTINEQSEKMHKK